MNLKCKNPGGQAVLKTTDKAIIITIWFSTCSITCLETSDNFTEQDIKSRQTTEISIRFWRIGFCGRRQIFILSFPLQWTHCSGKTRDRFCRSIFARGIEKKKGNSGAKKLILFLCCCFFLVCLSQKFFHYLSVWRGQ